MLLSDSVNTRDGLQLQCRIENRLAKQDVTCVNKVKPAGLRPAVKEETFNSCVVLEVFNASGVID